MQTYLTEFPGRTITLPEPMPEGFIDDSWHNDACPCFARGDFEAMDAVRIWIEADAPAEREHPDGPRYFMQVGPYGESEKVRDLYNGDDWQALLEALARHDATTKEEG
jgi:hypothetical protein